MSVDKNVATSLQAWAIKMNGELSLFINRTESATWAEWKQVAASLGDDEPTTREEAEKLGYKAVRVRIEEVKEGE